MNVDDAGRYAGADLRRRFDGLPAPALDVRVAGGASARSRRGGALAGIAAVLVVVLVIVVVARTREGGTGSTPGGSWKRVEVRAAFGRGARVTQVFADGSRFVAIGTRGAAPAPRPAVWTSRDGDEWSPIEGARFPGVASPFPGWVEAVVRRGTIVASTYAGDLWRSTDARTWRRVAQLGRPAAGPYLAVVAHRYLAITPIPAASNAGRVWTSGDGRRWSEVLVGEGLGTVPGLIPSARLGRTWLSLRDTGSETAPQVFGSSNALNWSVIASADPPVRLAEPLVSDHSHSEVLGIQYEHYESRYSFGGRLWSTRDGVHWTGITSFHERMPVANPDQLVQSGQWWVLGGNRGTADGLRRVSMWSSPDLRHWYELPRALRGPETSGNGFLLSERAGRVVGLSNGDRAHFLVIWAPPD